MRKRIYKELVTRFRQELENRLPQFSPHQEKADNPTWAWMLAPNVTFFVMLQPLATDQFVVEIGWSDDGTYPIEALPSHPPAIGLPRYRERLAQLWATESIADSWAIVPEETNEERSARMKALASGDIKKWAPVTPPEEEVLSRVAPLVVDAIQRLIEFGLPVFRNVAGHHGLAWSCESSN